MSESMPEVEDDLPFAEEFCETCQGCGYVDTGMDDGPDHCPHCDFEPEEVPHLRVCPYYRYPNPFDAYEKAMDRAIPEIVAAVKRRAALAEEARRMVLDGSGEVIEGTRLLPDVLK